MKKVIAYFVIWTVAVNVFGILALNRLDLRHDPMSASFANKVQTWNPLLIHGNWDAKSFISIAKFGYSFPGIGIGSTIESFPLYPLLLKIFGFIFFENYLLAGWALSLSALLIALLYFYKLVKEFHPEVNPYIPIIFLLIFPTAFFLNAIYSESLFLFLSIACFYYGLKRNFVAAGIFGFFAALTRSTGLFLFLPLIFIYFSDDSKFSQDQKINRDILPLFLIPAGIAVYFSYLQYKFGNFFLYYHAQNYWRKVYSHIWELVYSLRQAQSDFIINVLLLIFVLIATIFVYKRLRKPYALYMITVILVPLTSGIFISQNRFFLILFPIYILAATIKSEIKKNTWAFCSILLLALNIILYVNFYWAG